MNYKRFLLQGFMALLFLGLSCAPRETAGPAPEGLAPATEKPASSGLTGWETEG